VLDQCRWVFLRHVVAIRWGGESGLLEDLDWQQKFVLEDPEYFLAAQESIWEAGALLLG
jgi:hypothetical protein